jgi:hypothetical protein
MGQRGGVFMRVFAGALLAGLLVGLGGCAAGGGEAAVGAGGCPLPGQVRAVGLKLYFGRDVPGGGFVDDAQWSDFAARVLTPAFPEGFTEYAAVGQWRDSRNGRIVRERSFVVERVGAVAPEKVEAVVRAYRTEFKQEAVGMVSDEVCAAF